MPCEICDDTRWKTTVDEQGVSRVTRCDCWYQGVSRNLFDAARIPRGYQHCELTNFERHTDSQRDAYRHALNIVDKFPAEKGLLLYGDTGVGKTHLAIALLKELIRRKWVRGVFYETQDLLRVIRDTYNRDVEATELGVLRPVLEADVLVLDDLRVDKKSAWVDETLGLVINSRYSERRTTIITTNLADTENTDPNSVAFQLGLRVRSRLLEMCRWVRMESHDTREVGPEPSHESIANWEKTSPASPKNRPRAGLPQKSTGQARAQLRTRDQGKADLKWPGGRAGS